MVEKIVHACCLFYVSTVHIENKPSIHFIWACKPTAVRKNRYLGPSRNLYVVKMMGIICLRCRRNFNETHLWPMRNKLSWILLM